MSTQLNASTQASRPLSFSGLPPIDVPFRYFITAPLFVIAIAIMIFLTGDSLWISRWQGEMLAITHAFTLGFMASIMLGALFQLLPVTAGISIGKPHFIATINHSLHTMGSIILILGFIINDHILQITAAILLGSSFTFYLAVFAYYFIKNQQAGENRTTNHVLNAIKLALFALLITVSLGLLLQTKVIGLHFIEWDKQFTDLHALWGLSGWVSLLIMAISFQVIPMFHVAPEFPLWMKRYLAKIIFVVLITLFIAKFLPSSKFYSLTFNYVLVFLNALFVINLLNILYQRKRKIADSTINYWRLASINMLLCCVLFVVPENILPQIVLQKLPILLAIFFIFGYVVSILQGMLLKILPFLVFTHLQQQCMFQLQAMQSLPNMHEILTKRHGQIQFLLHCLTLSSLLITVLWTPLYFVLAITLLGEFIWLSFLITKTYVLYRRYHKQISSLVSAQ